MPTIRNNARKEVTSAKTREPHDSLGYMAEGNVGFKGLGLPHATVKAESDTPLPLPSQWSWKE